MGKILNNLNIVSGADLSLSVYNNEYCQSYHSKSLGAYSESMIKHILPALIFMKYSSNLDSKTYNIFLDELQENISFLDSKDIESNITKINILKEKYTNINNVRILDICFGLGYNAMLALECFKECKIYSPEKDYILPQLLHFDYLYIKDSKKILKEIINHGIYKNNKQILYFLYGDAIHFIESFQNNFFNIIFQDAFSQKYNNELWSLSYFQKLYKMMTKNSIITTYAKARNILESAKSAGFKVFKYSQGSLFIKF